MHANKRPRQDDRKTKKQPLSCAECRRLKLKVLSPPVPCAYSPPPVRSRVPLPILLEARVCRDMSRRSVHPPAPPHAHPPTGALTSGKGSRFILANTEQLHAKIIQMSDRIRQLEDALGALQATCATDPHPLLTQDLLRIKNSLELYSPQPAPSRPHLPDDPTPSSSLLPSPDADRRPSEVSLRPVSSASSAPPQDSSVEIAPTDIPRLSPEIEKLSQTFPYPWLTNNPMRERIYSMLPSRQEAEYLCTQARLNALWQ
jgi:hypothetical protein